MSPPRPQAFQASLPYLKIDIETFLLRQQLGDVQLVCGSCPVDRQPAVVVLAFGKCWLGLLKTRLVSSDALAP